VNSNPGSGSLACAGSVLCRPISRGVFAAGVVLSILAGCTQPTAGPAKTAAAPFVLGADISFLDTPGGGRWGPLPEYKENGVASDELTILRNHGWTGFRVRVFVSPVREAPNSTLEAAIPLAKRIKAAGATFLLCIHLSDTWADPQHQETPKAWAKLDIDGLEKQVEAYTYDVIKQLKAAGAMPDWVQVGNEITPGMLWPLAQLKVPGATKYLPPEPYDDARQWDHLTRLLKAGIRGVKAAAGDTPPRIAIHIDKGANRKVTQWFLDHLEQAHVEYDIIAQSFYPEWNHGTLDQLWENMNNCAQRYKKDFLVVETGYGHSHAPGNQSMFWPETPEGRLQFMADIINTVKKAPRGIGVMYWAPEREAWNADGTPGPVVSVLDQLDKLKARPASHAPAAVNP